MPLIVRNGVTKQVTDRLWKAWPAGKYGWELAANNPIPPHFKKQLKPSGPLTPAHSDDLTPAPPPEVPAGNQQSFENLVTGGDEHDDKPNEPRTAAFTGKRAKRGSLD